MKKFYYIIIFKLIALNFIYSQAPTYNLTVKNFSLASINHQYDALYFDVYLEWTNPGVAPNFEFAGQQLYFSFNHNVLTGPWPPTGGAANPDTTNYSYKIVGSEIPTAMQTRGQSLYTATSPTADIMRGAVNTFPGAGFGINIPAGYPGVKLARYRLWNKNTPFNQVDLNFAWRNPPVVAFTTKIFAYVGTTNTDITTPGTHAIEFNGFSLLPIAPANLISPVNNSIDIPTNVQLVWNKVTSANRYNLILSDDSLFNNIILNDTAVIDTFKTINNLYLNTKYYWKVISKSLYFESISDVWNFRTLSQISLNLTIIPEGLYNNYFNLMNRKDSITVFLRSIVSPYNVIDSSKKPIDSISFSNIFYFSNAPPGVYYIVIKHLNCLETWSKSGGEIIIFEGNGFDFTVAASQAYGNNLKLKGNKYCIYSGDINKDGFIDGADVLLIDNDSYNFNTGINLPTDLNGDGVVDGIDFLIGDNNWQYITAKSPLSISDSGFKHRVKKYYEP